MKIRIYYEDTDSGGIVYHANYLKFCERARSEFCFLNGVKFSPKSHFVVTKITANFIKSARLGDVIFVRTKVEKIGKASIILEQNIEKIASLDGENFGKNPQIIFNAKVTLAFMNDGKIGKIDENLAEIFKKLL